MKFLLNAKRIKVVASLALLLTTVGGSMNKVRADDNPFQPGTETITLTDAERSEFLDYVSQAKILIDQARALAAGKSVTEKRRIYTRASLDAVRAIATANTRTQLLSQMAINQAIALTMGVPNSDGTTIPVAGLLDGNDPKLEPVVEMIMEDSLSIAYRYLDAEAQGLQQTSFQLPFADFAGWRLAYAQKWLVVLNRASFTPISSYLKLVLNQFMSVMLQPAQLERAKYAAQIEEVDAAINPKSYPGSVGYTDDEKATLMSGALDTVSSEMNSALLANVTDGAPDLPIFNSILVANYRPGPSSCYYCSQRTSASDLIDRTLTDNQIETLLTEAAPSTTSGSGTNAASSDFDLIASHFAVAMNYTGPQQSSILVHSATDDGYDWGSDFDSYFNKYAQAVAAGLSDDQVKSIFAQQQAVFDDTDCNNKNFQVARRRGIVLIGDSKSAMREKALKQIKKMENSYKGHGCVQFKDLVKQFLK